MTTFRCAVSITTLVMSIALFTVFAGAPHAGSAYQISLGPAADHLPGLTASFSLPFLRTHAANPFSEERSALWVMALWAVLLTCFPATLLWTVRAPNVENALARWVAGVSVSASLILVVTVFTVAGLLMPWFPL